ncbi:glycoside hydrolase family 25 protein [Paenibacillus sp. FSL R5-0527]|uniref:glycoside hydrolase family 25 protein n=1 Tax=Paenibacillus sp. FSL R5-0527 TaxID=2975321 RepID=UPI00097A12AE|nr:hypothetical protein BK140_22510 [Paenibacillus macerans]
MQSRKQGNAQGIDVSHHNGYVDWAKVAADGISFVFLKASEGKTFVDSTFKNNAKAARAAGLLVGAYHFVNATSTGAAELEARHFANTIQGVPLDLSPVMDYENNPGGLGRSQVNDVAETFLFELERLTGKRPIVYTGNSFASNFSPLLGAYPLWIARYSTQVPTDVSAWRQWTFWQYSDGKDGGTRQNGSRKVAGLGGYVDLNEFNGTLAELKAWAGITGKDAEKVAERDINKVSAWAAENWAEAVANGYFDGSRPGAQITREETAIVVNRLRRNFLRLIAANTEDIAALDKRMQEIEQE